MLKNKGSKAYSEYQQESNKKKNQDLVSLNFNHTVGVWCFWDMIQKLDMNAEFSLTKVQEEKTVFKKKKKG